MIKKKISVKKHTQNMKAYKVLKKKKNMKK